MVNWLMMFSNFFSLECTREIQTKTIFTQCKFIWLMISSHSISILALFFDGVFLNNNGSLQTDTEQWMSWKGLFCFVFLEFSFFFFQNKSPTFSSFYFVLSWRHVIVIVSHSIFYALNLPGIYHKVDGLWIRKPYLYAIFYLLMNFE